MTTSGQPDGGPQQHGGRHHGIPYDGLDRTSTVTYPGSSTQAFTYDADSNVLTSTTRKGDVFTFSYDTLNRLITQTPPGSAPVTTYA